MSNSSPCAYSVTTQKSLSVSKASNIKMMLSWFRVRRMPISCRRFLMSFSLLPCFWIIFMATVNPVFFLRAYHSLG